MKKSGANRSSSKKQRTNRPGKAAEKWCFACKDGGFLMLCDHEDCTKVYHLECVSKKSSFLEKRESWICSHHSCSVCLTRTAPMSFSCLLCTYSVCSSCRKASASGFSVLRGKEQSGLCAECLKIVKIAEGKSEIGSDAEDFDFDDTDTFECRFKECWEILKEKENLSLVDFYTKTEGSEDTETKPEKAEEEPLIMFLKCVGKETGMEFQHDVELIIRDYVKKFGSAEKKRKAWCDHKLDLVSENGGIDVVEIFNTIEPSSQLGNGDSDEDDEDKMTLRNRLALRQKRKVVTPDHQASSDI